MTGSQFPGQIGALSAHAPGTAERVNDAVPITAGVLAILGVLAFRPVTERWCEQGYAQPHPPQHPYAQRPYPPVPAPAPP